MTQCESVKAFKDPVRRLRCEQDASHVDEVGGARLHWFTVREEGFTWTYGWA